MRLGTFTVAGASAGAIAFALAAPLFGGCSRSHPPPPPTSSGSSGGPGGACQAGAGVFPAPNCDNTDESCTAPNPACPTSPCNGSSPCLAMADNTGNPVDDMRLRKLNVTAPPALALAFIQASVIDQGVNLKSYCGEGGDGSFSWLVRFDPTNGKVTTGGAPPTDDPFHVGYCFVNATVNGLQVKPVTVNVTQGSDGTWSSDVIEKLNVPIYVHGDPQNVVVLPISQARVQGVGLSKDGNCIGTYNPDGVTSPQGATSTCLDQDPSSCQRWHTAGSLGGYITLKEAEGVYVADLGKTLCVLLTQGAATTNGGKDCATDANGDVTAAGDFCSTTDSPASGSCHDSFWLAATFAASAALITDGASVSACNGSQLTDAGSSSGGDAASESGGAEGGSEGGSEGGTSEGGGGDSGTGSD
jgi:hypothetical protein